MWGFSDVSDGEEFACNAGDQGLIPGSGRSPGEGNGYPFQYSCLESSMDRWAWWATVHRVAESRMWLSKQHFHFQGGVRGMGGMSEEQINKCLLHPLLCPHQLLGSVTSYNTRSPYTYIVCVTVPVTSFQSLSNLPQVTEFITTEQKFTSSCINSILLYSIWARFRGFVD